VGVVRTRPIALGDSEATRAIYNLEVLESTVTFDIVPRTPEEQVRWIEQHLGGHPAIVAVDDDDTVLGFASLSPFRARAAYSPTVEDSIYVHRDSRGRGVGELLLREILVVGTNHGFHSVMARIVGGHDASITLHRKCGFREIGCEREVGRKFGRWLDVVLMQMMLQG
jgi:phosphinothricin acetyltransferase